MNLCDSCSKFDAGCPWSRETPASGSVCCEHSPITRAQLSTAQAELAAVSASSSLVIFRLLLVDLFHRVPQFRRVHPR